MRRFFLASVMVLCGSLAMPVSLWAMHISEGILPLPWALFWWVIMLVFLGLALRRVTQSLREDPQRKSLFAFVTALIFLFSVIPIPVPIAGTCSHPVGVAVGVFILGLSGSIVAGFIVLLLQTLLLAHGGISSLGANVVSMAVAGSLSAYLLLLLLTRFSISIPVKAFLCGLLADWATYFMTALQLTLALREGDPFLEFFLKILLAFAPTQIPLGILEGVITASLITVIARKRRELLLSKALNP